MPEAATPTPRAPRSPARQELNELALVLRRVEKLSEGGKRWLLDRLHEDLGTDQPATTD